MSFLVIFLCIYYVSTAVASPYTIPRLLGRDTSSIFPTDIAPAINATITDHAGKDITSLFEIMLFYDPSAPCGNTSHANNSSDDSLRNRQTPGYRQITNCPTPGATFVSSECTPTDNKLGSLQTYSITCHRTENMYHPYTGEFLYSRPVPVRRSGHCWFDEVCINGFGPGNELVNSIGLKIANCVNRRSFELLKAPIGLELDKQSMARSFEGKRLSMVVSKADESTPMEVDTFDVQARGAAVEDAKGGSTARCRDCMDLETQQFKKGVESLKAEATMLTTRVAMAGILWMALI